MIHEKSYIKKFKTRPKTPCQVVHANVLVVNKILVNKSFEV